jgi:signal transduction histidine kinase
VASLEDGTPAPEAVASAMNAAGGGNPAIAGIPAFVQIVDEDGRTLSVGPEIPGGGGMLAVSIEGGDQASAGPGAGSPTSPTPGPQSEALDPDDADALDRRTTLIAANRVFSFEPETLSRTVATPSGELTVFAAAPVDEVQENLEAVRRGLWVGVPLLVAAVAAVAWHLVGRALRPVEAIRAEVAAIGGTTIHRRVPTPGTDDEIGRLAHTMNAMLDRLEVASTRQRQFVSDASHELRSPVAAIRTDVEVALREGERADWPTVGAAVLAEEVRLERLLDDLLTLAAADEAAGTGAAGRADERVDVGDLVADVAARPRRVPVRWERADDHGDHGATPEATDAVGAVAPPAGPAPPGGPVVSGRPDALSRLLTNLVDNAARHATTSVEVRVDVASSPTGTQVVHLAVDDDGPGIPAGDRQRIFDRFTRLDDGRARARGGAGLGLAVVRSIAVGHRGRVWVGDSPTGGARFVVELPVAPAAP